MTFVGLIAAFHSCCCCCLSYQSELFVSRPSVWGLSMSPLTSLLIAFFKEDLCGYNPTTAALSFYFVTFWPLLAFSRNDDDKSYRRHKLKCKLKVTKRADMKKRQRDREKEIENGRKSAKNTSQNNYGCKFLSLSAFFLSP